MNTVMRKTLIVLVTALLTVSIGVEAKKDKKVEDELKVRTNSLSMPRSDDVSSSEITPMGQAEFEGLCKYRGHEGKYQCVNVKPTKHDKWRRSKCPGKNLYLTDGECYECPTGYKRNILHLKMTHPKACVKHTKGTNPKSAGDHVEKAYKGCPDGQFKYKGYCHTCPAKTKRKHFLGLDKGQCRVEKKYRCVAGLALHKSQPKNLWNSAGNWIGLKHRKYCGLPFNLNSYLLDAAATDANVSLAEAIIPLVVKLASKDRETKKKIKNFKKALKDGKLTKAYGILKKFDEFKDLEDAALEGQQLSISIGVEVDASILAGFNTELGLAIDIGQRKLVSYRTHGLSKGFSLGFNAGVSVGVWKGEFETSFTQGYVVDIPGLGSVAAWSDYYTPKRDTGLNQPRFVGMSYANGFGGSVEIGEYNEVWTKVGEFLECDIKSGFRLDC